MSSRWGRRRLITGLVALLLSPVLSVLLTMPGARGGDAPLPVVTLPSSFSALIGEEVGFDVSFVNGSSAPGFGPFVDLTMPLGADGYDGLTFDGATYLGVDVTSTVLHAAERPSDHKVCVTHPYAVDNAGLPVQICDLAMGQPLLVVHTGSAGRDRPRDRQDG